MHFHYIRCISTKCPCRKLILTTLTIFALSNWTLRWDGEGEGVEGELLCLHVRYGEVPRYVSTSVLGSPVLPVRCCPWLAAWPVTPQLTHFPAPRTLCLCTRYLCTARPPTPPHGYCVPTTALRSHHNQRMLWLHTSALHYGLASHAYPAIHLHYAKWKNYVLINQVTRQIMAGAC